MHRMHRIFSVFVSIRVHWWFVFSDDPLFHSRMIHPVVGGRGLCLPESRGSGSLTLGDGGGVENLDGLFELQVFFFRSGIGSIGSLSGDGMD